MEKVKSRKMWLVVGAFVFLSFLILFSWNGIFVEASGTMIVINPGHMDGADPGAVNSSNGIREVDLNNALAIKTVATLRASGYNAMLSHPVPGNPGLPTLLATRPDYSVYTKTICDAANAKGADLLLSIHHNAGGNASGYELYWSSYHPTVDVNGIYEASGLWPGGDTATLDRTPSGIALRSKALANSLNENFKSLDYVPTRNKIVERDDGIIRRTSMPSVLIEAGFVSNNAESQQMANGNNQQKMANQILKSVNALFGNQAAPMTAKSVVGSVSGSKITATITGITAPNGIKQIQVPIWSNNNGQDDIRWYTATKQSNGKYSVTIDVKDHNYDGGAYIIHAYGVDNNDKMVFLGNTTVNVKVAPMTATSVVGSVSGNKITATITGITAPNGIKQIQVPIWSENKGQDDIKWYTASRQSDESYSVTIDIKDHNYDGGVYQIHCYGVDTSGKCVFLASTSAEIISKGVPIMGTSTVTADQLIEYYESTGEKFPQLYIDRGVNLETFVNMYIQESAAEGVRAEVAFAQAMLETGQLQFSGDVKVGQFNFAGLGATGGVPGYDFASVYGDNRIGIQTGIRAHVQHLKCYASDLPLNQVKVDPRWGDWIRLKAISVEGLAGTWATDKQYATKILNVMKQF